MVRRSPNDINVSGICKLSAFIDIAEVLTVKVLTSELQKSGQRLSGSKEFAVFDYYIFM